MSQTITSLTTTQLTDGTERVSFSFTATNASTLNLALTYAWQLQTNGTYVPATTTGPVNVSAVSGGTAVTGWWDIPVDIETPKVNLPVTFQVNSFAPAVFATGTLTAVAANASTGIKEADTVTIGGRIYEFTTDATIGAGHVAVTIPSATATAAQVQAALILAINTDASHTVQAIAGTGTNVNLTALLPGTTYNIIITQSISNSATLTPVVVAGVNIVTVSATSNITLGHTGTIEVVIPDTPYNFSKKLIEGTWDNYGWVAQGNMFGAYAKKVYHAVKVGTREYAKIFGDRNAANERAVLVNAAYWLANQSNAPTWNVVVKPIAWFTDIAARTLSDSTQWGGNTVYAIASTHVKPQTNVHALKKVYVIEAYLVSAAQFAAVVGE